jgi:hypothetical protein
MRVASPFFFLARRCLNSSAFSIFPATHFDSNPALFEVVGDGLWNDVEKLDKMKEIGLQVRSNFASPDEQVAMHAELENGPFKKLKWETGHWDSVITNYRETERLVWTNPLSLQGIYLYL